MTATPSPDELVAALLADLEEWAPAMEVGASRLGEGELSMAFKVAANRVRAAAALIRELVGREKWLPIETAPKDGTRIIAYPVTMNEAGVVSWEPPSRTPPMMRIVSGENHDQDGFWRVLLSMKPSPYPPTHWRPLPAPPVEAK